MPAAQRDVQLPGPVEQVVDYDRELRHRPATATRCRAGPGPHHEARQAESRKAPGEQPPPLCRTSRAGRWRGPRGRRRDQIADQRPRPPVAPLTSPARPPLQGPRQGAGPAGRTPPRPAANRPGHSSILARSPGEFDEGTERPAGRSRSTRPAPAASAGFRVQPFLRPAGVAGAAADLPTACTVASSAAAVSRSSAMSARQQCPSPTCSSLLFAENAATARSPGLAEAQRRPKPVVGEFRKRRPGQHDQAACEIIQIGKALGQPDHGWGYLAVTPPRLTRHSPASGELCPDHLETGTHVALRRAAHPRSRCAQASIPGRGPTVTMAFASGIHAAHRPQQTSPR